jgi:predicted N-acetyltransferase YhbS
MSMDDASMPAPAWRIRSERPSDADAIEALNEACFGPGRFAKTAYRLREGVEPIGELGFVAEEAGALTGSVRFWPIRAGGADALLLGPLAVRSESRGRGMGVALMRRGIEAAQATEFIAILLVGDEPYYKRAGFAPLAPGRLTMPGPVDPRRLLVLALKPDALERLFGDIRRARVDHPASAGAAPLS